MLTSFFGKSSPINYLLTALVIAGAYIFVVIPAAPEAITLRWGLEHLLDLIVLVFSILLLDFIIRKNGLTLSNNYGIFLFGCFLLCISSVFIDQNIVIANLFIMLALRRMLSLRSGKKFQKKVLDAALWIGVATFFYFWSFLLLPVLFFAILQQDNFKRKHLFIPIIGLLAVGVLATSFFILSNDTLLWFSDWMEPPGFNFAPYNELTLLLPVTLITTLLLWTGIARFMRISKLAKKARPGYYLLLLILISTVAMALVSPLKTGAELLFLITPLSIVVANYIEHLEEFWFKELLLWGLLITPVVLLFV